MKAGQIWGEGRREWQGNPLSANFSKWVVYLEVVFLQNFLILKLFSRSLLAPSKISFLVLRKSLLHGINRCSIWIYTLKMRKGMTRLCISREMRTIKMWRCCYWRLKVQKWMVWYRREAHMMAKSMDTCLSVCWEQRMCNIQVTVAVLFLLLLLSPFALCLWILSFTKAASLHLGEKGNTANWPLQPGMLLGASCTFIQLCSAL